MWITFPKNEDDKKSSAKKLKIEINHNNLTHRRLNCKVSLKQNPDNGRI